jgi:hypothetical protein
MWAEASQAIEVATGMRVRIQSDSMIDTFAPMHRGYLHGRVLKRPVSSGGYEIVANMDCGSYGYGCRNDINNAINLFNINVNQAGQPFVNKK